MRKDTLYITIILSFTPISAEPIYTFSLFLIPRFRSLWNVSNIIIEFPDFPFICFDMMENKDGKAFIIESNAQPGVPFDSTVKLYEALYKDFYKQPIDAKSKSKLNEYAKEMIEKTIKKNPNRFNA